MYMQCAKGTQRWAGTQGRPPGTGQVSLRMKELNLEEKDFEMNVPVLRQDESKSVGLCTFSSFFSSRRSRSNDKEDLLLVELK